jgi:hypothetical protein
MRCRPLVSRSCSSSSSAISSRMNEPNAEICFQSDAGRCGEGGGAERDQENGEDAECLGSVTCRRGFP